MSAHNVLTALPFERYPDGGRALLGRPRQGDLTARHGYGPPVFAVCGLACAYCGFDMGSRYEDWLQLSVDHVVPAGSRSTGYRGEWLEDIVNLVTCCRPCNEFSNAFRVADSPPVSIDEFLEIRDRAFIAKRELLRRKHEAERTWFEDHVVADASPTGPRLPADPTP